MKRLSVEQKVEMVMQVFGISSLPGGAFCVEAEPEPYQCKTFEDALKAVLERERKETSREISEAVEGWLSGLCVRNPDAGNRQGVTQ
jgi:hypothetical protein